MKKRKILLVSPMLHFGPFLPINISILIAVLEKAGYDIELFDTTFYKIPAREMPDETYVNIKTFKPVNWDGYRMDELREDPAGDFKQRIKEFGPDFIGISFFTTFNENFALSLIEAIDDDFQGKVIVGGMHTLINLDRIKSQCH